MEVESLDPLVDLVIRILVMDLLIGGVNPQSAKQLVVNAVLRRKIGGGPCAQGLAELSIFFPHVSILI